MFEKLAIGLYSTGILAGTMVGIHTQTLEVEKTYTNPNYFDYAINSLGGALIGTFTGVFWPCTVIG